MNAMNLVKKTAAVVLSAAVAVGSLSLANVVTEGADVTLGEGTQTGNYISMPITIRDFAADGMLFDPNPVGSAGTLQVEDTSSSSLPEPNAKFRPANVGSITNSNMAPTAKTGAGGYLRFKSSSANPYITFWMPSGLVRSNAKYLVIKYRTNAAATDTPYIYHRGPSKNYTSKNFPTAGYNDTSVWTTKVVSLAHDDDWDTTKSESLSYVTFFPKLASGKYMDIAFAAFFNTKAKAQTYADAMADTTDYDTAVPKNTYILKSNLGYGLVMTNDYSYVNNLPLNGTNNITGSQFYKNDGTNNVVTPQNVTLNSGATMVGYGGMMRLDMVQGQLGDNKQLLYTEGTVKYIAEMLQSTLPIVWQNDDGTYNLHYVMGNDLFNDNLEYVGPGGTKGLADVLRNQITGGLGTYAEAAAKNPKNLSDIVTYYDAAYYLLHNIFSDSTGYGTTVSEYNSLRLLEKKKSDGTIFYTFNSAYNDTVYDVANGVIYNSQTTLANARSTDSGGIYYTRGNVLPEATFNPIPNSGYGTMTQVYYEIAQHMDDSSYGTDLTKYYANTNFNFSLEGHAQFVYREDDNLYFTFTGDDDVYLFINGKRVLDLGGGHAISKAHVDLNSLKSVLGLVEGAVCDFDFYYMERGGGAGNFGIETNMKIVEPSMVTNMLGFQNGVTTGYNGFVDPSKNVGYGYELTNSGNEPITNLTFTNAAIGVSLTKDAITLNSRSNINEMYAIIYDATGSIRARFNPGQLTVDVLKQLLADGIDAGEKFGVYGVKYDITNDDWSAGGDTFTNTVNTTAESRDNVTLTGYSEWKVQKRNYSYDCFNVYTAIEQGTKKSVTVTKTELLVPITKAGQSVTESAVDIVLCSPSGNTDTTAISKNVTLNSDGSITYTAPEKAGVENIYYKVTGGTWENVVFHYHAYTYSVEDNAFVLDYGLPVELNDAAYGFMVNDRAVLSENANTTTTITGITNATANYGSFTYSVTSLKYTPNKFMSGVDSVTVTIQVLENDATSLTKFTGVTMTQTIKVMPANVVYYEDDFAGLTYLNNNGNQWNQATDSGTQSADPNGNYGSDSYYSNDNDSVHSGGTVSALNVTTTADVLTFDFTGTGFEVVSHTTYGQYAVIDVTVTKANGEFVRRQPVITESKGGHLYQVPIISITGLDRDAYTVTVKAANSTAGVVRMFYVDGIRVFNPLDDTNAQTYYNPGEYNAQFLEVKQLIDDGKTVYANGSEATTELQFATGTTLIEDVQSNGVLTSVGSLSDYMTFGPNNEIYLDGNAAVGMIAFYLVPDGTDAGSSTIQIGAHRKVDSVNGANGSVTMVYGSTAADLVAGTNAYTLYNGTEQYYTIDVADLTMDEDGRYLVMIGTNGSATPGEILSLTTLKLSGYTLVKVEDVLTAAAAEDALNEVSVVDEAADLFGQNTGAEE